MGPHEFHVCQQVSKSHQASGPGPDAWWLRLTHWRTWTWCRRPEMTASACAV